MIKQLTKLANHLDAKGLTKEADLLDEIIKEAFIPPEAIDIINCITGILPQAPTPGSDVPQPTLDPNSLAEGVCGCLNASNIPVATAVAAWPLIRSMIPEEYSQYLDAVDAAVELLSSTCTQEPSQPSQGTDAQRQQGNRTFRRQDYARRRTERDGQTSREYAAESLDNY